MKLLNVVFLISVSSSLYSGYREDLKEINDSESVLKKRIQSKAKEQKIPEIIKKQKMQPDMIRHKARCCNFCLGLLTVALSAGSFAVLYNCPDGQCSL